MNFPLEVPLLGLHASPLFQVHVFLPIEILFSRLSSCVFSSMMPFFCIIRQMWTFLLGGCGILFVWPCLRLCILGICVGVYFSCQTESCLNSGTVFLKQYCVLCITSHTITDAQKMLSVWRENEWEEYCIHLGGKRWRRRRKEWNICCPCLPLFFSFYILKFIQQSFSEHLFYSRHCGRTSFTNRN